MEQYEKIRKIGEGAFGTAWLVSSRKSKSLKVIKEIGISGVTLTLRLWNTVIVILRCILMLTLLQVNVVYI